MGARMSAGFANIELLNKAKALLRDYQTTDPTTVTPAQANEYMGSLVATVASLIELVAELERQCRRITVSRPDIEHLEMGESYLRQAMGQFMVYRSRLHENLG